MVNKTRERVLKFTIGKSIAEETVVNLKGGLRGLPPNGQSDMLAV